MSSEMRSSVIIASILRSTMLEAFVGVCVYREESGRLYSQFCRFLFFSIERAIATFAWSWWEFSIQLQFQGASIFWRYEKESAHTLVAFVLLEGCAQLWSWSWSIALIFGKLTSFSAPTLPYPAPELEILNGTCFKRILTMIVEIYSIFLKQKQENRKNQIYLII